MKIRLRPSTFPIDIDWSRLILHLTFHFVKTVRYLDVISDRKVTRRINMEIITT
jgi:hypothetical protein